MDLLRFHLFTMGGIWTAEYGSPDDADDFAALVKISPLHSASLCSCGQPSRWTDAALAGPRPAQTSRPSSTTRRAS